MPRGKAPKRRVAYDLPPNMETFLESAQFIQSVFAKGLRPDGSCKPEMVLALLKFRRVNVTALAETHGYDESYFRQVINRERRDAKVEDIMAGEIGINPDRMWGRRLLDGVANAR